MIGHQIAAPQHSIELAAERACLAVASWPTVLRAETWNETLAVVLFDHLNRLASRNASNPSSNASMLRMPCRLFFVFPS
jgi:hypothetical protein